MNYYSYSNTLFLFQQSNAISAINSTNADPPLLTSLLIALLLLLTTEYSESSCPELFFVADDFQAIYYLGSQSHIQTMQ